jgi:hypothetical protein
MNVKKISVGLLMSLMSVQAAAFSDIGTSKKSCSSAKRDAQVIAQSHCYSLDTSPKVTLGSCKKRKFQGEKQFRVPVYYKCLVQTARFDYGE